MKLTRAEKVAITVAHFHFLFQQKGALLIYCGQGYRWKPPIINLLLQPILITIPSYNVKTNMREDRKSASDKLKIVIRIRPTLNGEDPAQFVSLEGNDSLEIRRPGNYSYMKFNNILPAQSTQNDVFGLMQDSIKHFLRGTNTTVFAYGQTGAGKTYSIIGNYSPDDSQQNLFNFRSSKERGVLSRSLEMIMASAYKDPSTRFTASFYQIYNQKIYDLYNYSNMGLEIRQNKSGQISIPDLVSIEISRIEDAIDFLMVGLKNRATGSTHANAKSSRSHSIFQISMERKENGHMVSSSLRIVDLAGSEKFKIPSDLTGAEKQVRIQELTSINSSLSCLGHCISALIDKSRTHIPFRNSKLTRILSDSLLGQGKMRFIICISPSVSAAAQTFSTLQFANRAKRAIFDRADRTPSPLKKKSEGEEVSTLKRELQGEKEARVAAQRQVVELRRIIEQLRGEKKHWIAQSKANSNSSGVGYKQDSRVGYYDQNKENQFKQQMLKLKIFQKHTLNYSESELSPRSVNQPQTFNQSNHSQHERDRISASNQRKKVQFERKIKKFIQSDSPYHSTEQSLPHPNPLLDEECSFGNNVAPKMAMHHQVVHSTSEKDTFEQNLWELPRDDSNQFIEKTCHQMNVPEFREFQDEMEKARTELLNLKRKDKELEQRKSLLR